MGLRILKGENTGAIPVKYRSRSLYMFDFRQMGRFGIKSSELPKGSEVVNKPEPFRRVRKELIWGAVAGLVTLSALVFFLLRVIRLRRRSLEFPKMAGAELEMKVQERTRDLSEFNERLRDDISARRRSEEELRKSQSILGKIFESNPDLLCVIDRVPAT